MSINARVARLEKLACEDTAEDHELSIGDVRGLEQWLREQGFEIDLLGGSHHGRQETIRMLRAALAAGLRTPPEFHLTIEDMLQAYEYTEAYRETRFGKGA
jgi:hypothetical protein